MRLKPPNEEAIVETWKTVDRNFKIDGVNAATAESDLRHLVDFVEQAQEAYPDGPL